ncbi:hypothetical protein A2962_01140 [Candidatus Woesebacteria bacterium RIFCSPLOWO2_01_FULL_39_61]|uniref:DUF5668 domain-containing protein n=1 Tax=Candidatus Woesebacteria bacterium RIFCSPHIGHO2_02_FULL_39_13 TaxID=1802505 RepID=A0A1F7YYG2_9BACT|nr:MAG: hypothetical protein A2692_02015 [Candidatus Woesebacteria bacterium RIFCSPHIGHO2_01_FULL_39_95]OGM32372.1 MAG: hypothetical protein A3D01_04275 [Candidatus Woesebacteria bacterium RIFCSPHIGHO2_02_FULL_39_13]OGM37559.1 MAG: hypothetical protein A3E13_05125 [Candidatus Woesebacteria bacterium RIFCSPHIGHO2_12_FULL_40_20]OGM65640.1 MAG: hypothetical protein A2962_01140 [Candidatus Woesebacteria bacterium RIFCSPLOWO2_01_FULL_39_61]OGM73911.1 MAG: hypothetical protein A3H19_06280 [Candidatus
MKKEAPINIFAIIFFTALAFALFFNLLGLFPWGIGSFLFKFWPIFLILLVLQLYSRKFPRLTSIGTAVGIGVIISIVFFSLAPINQRVNLLLSSYSSSLIPVRRFLGIDLGKKLTTQEKVERSNYPNPNKREVDISILAGTFNLTDNFEQDHLVVRANYFERFGKPEIISGQADDTLKINLTTQKSLGPIIGGAEDVSYDISIGTTKVPTDLDLDVGAANFFSYFRNLNLESVSMIIGGGNARVYFTKESLPKNHLTLSVGAGSLFLRVPFGTFARIKYHITVGSLIINDQTFYRDGVFTTSNSRIETNPLEISVNVGAGTLIIDSSGEENIY